MAVTRAQWLHKLADDMRVTIGDDTVIGIYLNNDEARTLIAAIGDGAFDDLPHVTAPGMVAVPYHPLSPVPPKGR